MLEMRRERRVLLRRLLRFLIQHLRNGSIRVLDQGGKLGIVRLVVVTGDCKYFSFEGIHDMIEMDGFDGIERAMISRFPVRTSSACKQISSGAFKRESFPFILLGGNQQMITKVAIKDEILLHSSPSVSIDNFYYAISLH